MTVQKTGIIVAGGKSRRLGQDKAEILYEGETLLGRAIHLLSNSGHGKIVIIGRPNHTLGTADLVPDEGPAANLKSWINNQTLPLSITVLPVDMPLLTKDQITALHANPHGSYFDDLYLPFAATVTQPIDKECVRMKDLLSALVLNKLPIPVHWRSALTNFNTAADFSKLSP